MTLFITKCAIPPQLLQLQVQYNSSTPSQPLKNNILLSCLLLQNRMKKRLSNQMPLQYGGNVPFLIWSYCISGIPLKYFFGVPRFYVRQTCARRLECAVQNVSYDNVKSQDALHLTWAVSNKHQVNVKENSKQNKTGISHVYGRLLTPRHTFDPLRRRPGADLGRQLRRHLTQRALILEQKRVDRALHRRRQNVRRDCRNRFRLATRLRTARGYLTPPTALTTLLCDLGLNLFSTHHGYNIPPTYVPRSGYTAKQNGVSREHTKTQKLTRLTLIDTVIIKTN